MEGQFNGYVPAKYKVPLTIGGIVILGALGYLAYKYIKVK
jgi:hypothetical protein